MMAIIPIVELHCFHHEPFRWDEVRRTQLHAELDAYYARLYGLTRDELRYILDPKEAYEKPERSLYKGVLYG